MLTPRILGLLLGAVATVTGYALASTVPVRRVLHEWRSAPPNGWHPHRRAKPDTVLPLTIALRQSNIHQLDDFLLDVADPGSPNYGLWWTPDQIREAFQPSAESSATVHGWLTSEGIDASRVQLSADRSYMRVDVSVAEAEKLLRATYYVYQNEDGSEDLGCHQGYHLPHHVVEHVDLVTPTVHFEKTHATQRKRSAAVAARHSSKMRRPHGVDRTKPHKVYADAKHCDQMATIDCFRALYDFYPNLTQTHVNTVGIVELGGELLNVQDLEMFLETFNPSAVGFEPDFVGIDSDDPPDFTSTDPNAVGEADLDFELMVGLLGREQRVTLYNISQGDSINFLLDAFDASYCTFEGGDDPDIDGVFTDGEDCGNKALSNVISISFVGAEDLPPAYMKRQCNEFGKLSLLGTTFLVPSGDNGVASNGENLCLAKNGTVVTGEGAFLPNYPATCPYVTAVGATQVDPGKTVHDPESATSRFGSGGGFSTVFPQPNFQQRLVRRYLSKLGHRVDPKLFNSFGRGVPDVSANGLPTAAVILGNHTVVGGTAAATTIFAAIIAAVNDARLAHRKSPVGLINPAIYSSFFADAFHDVTNGTNPGCGTDGFPALRGWDPVTGLGTPDFPKLVRRFLALP
ncbi:hypothetical protein BN946_scf184797.g2 [Trametes cinnabarina]|uniref:Peptidase S53 domain-containing protein n=1 Tax=Pycnoporus cinnabarinus TaxID=5643 RepID=A0A060SVJ5_PYCCI|nr:hypothetical protein BN946_scf184797.g2 [Trametes cinnabarina]